MTNLFDLIPAVVWPEEQTLLETLDENESFRAYAEGALARGALHQTLTLAVVLLAFGEPEPWSDEESESFAALLEIELQIQIEDFLAEEEAEGKAEDARRVARDAADLAEYRRITPLWLRLWRSIRMELKRWWRKVH